MYTLTLLGLLLTCSLFFAAATTNISLQSSSAATSDYKEKTKNLDRNSEAGSISDNDYNESDKSLDFPSQEQKEDNEEKNYVNYSNSDEFNNIDETIENMSLEDSINSSELFDKPFICSDSSLVVGAGESCPTKCSNGYFVMPGIECSDVGNPIQCEGTEIVVTDPNDCPQRCFGGDFDGFFVRERPECKINVEKVDINFQLCSTRLVVGDLSFCPVKCVTGPFSGFYVMDSRDCNWPKPNIQICNNGFVVDKFTTNCPIKCEIGQFNGFYVVDIKECNNNMQISTSATISSFNPLESFSSSNTSSSLPSLFTEHKELRLMKEAANSNDNDENEDDNSNDRDINNKELRLMKEAANSNDRYINNEDNRSLLASLSSSKSDSSKSFIQDGRSSLA